MIITQEKVLAVMEPGKEYTPENVVCLMFPNLFLNIRTKMSKLSLRKRVERRLTENGFVYIRVK